MHEVDRFSFMVICMSPGGRALDEVSPRIQKARLPLTNLRHLWGRRDIKLSIKGRVHMAPVRLASLYGSET